MKKAPAQPGNTLRALILPALAAVALSLFLGGCDLFGSSSSDSVVPKPETLNPEADAFSKSATRQYVWKENLRRSDRADSLLADMALKVVYGGDSVMAGVPKARLTVTMSPDTGPVPAAFLTRLGFHPDRALFTAAKIPDPGPGLPFPATPALGWRLDTTVGELRFVRVLDGVETVKTAGRRRECWAFAESTYWSGTNGALIGAGTTLMGSTGLALHRSEWSGFLTSAAGTGTVFREITAP